MPERPIDVARRIVRRAFARVHWVRAVDRARKASVEALEGRALLSDLPVATIVPVAIGGLVAPSNQPGPGQPVDQNLAPDWVNPPEVLGGLGGGLAPAAGGQYPLYPGGPLIGPTPGVNIPGPANPPQPAIPVVPIPLAPVNPPVAIAAGLDDVPQIPPGGTLPAAPTAPDSPPNLPDGVTPSPQAPAPSSYPPGVVPPGYVPSLSPGSPVPYGTPAPDSPPDGLFYRSYAADPDADYAQLPPPPPPGYISDPGVPF